MNTSFTAFSDSNSSSHAFPRIVVSVCIALCTMNVVSLIVSAIAGQWILDSNGNGIPIDFANVYAAGKMAIEGPPALAYDWDAHKRVQELVLNQAFDGYFGWHYPPPFLFIAAALSTVPYAAAFAGWMALSFAPYALMVRGLLGHRFGWLLACAFPVAVSNAMIGQNGFLTASLIGGTLYFIPARPVLAGVCLGLLTYKPQYGLLFPFVLAAAGYWRTFFSAVFASLVIAGWSWRMFGSETWVAFFHWLPKASQAFLSDGFAEFGKMQSLLALIRFIGGGDRFASVAQWTFAFAVLVAMVALWRRNVRYELKAAALATGALLATPYLYLYDMVVLVVPIAMILRIAMETGFYRYDLAALGAATALLVSFQFVVAPVGFVATLIVAWLILRRVLVALRQSNSSIESSVIGA